MNTIKMFLTIVITVALSTILIVFFEYEDTLAKGVPQELYQVYLSGEKIGVIRSKEALEKYIDDKQEAVKKKYGVKNVYPPKQLNIQKYITYEAEVSSEQNIYEKIKEKEPFTVKGYVITINNGDKPLKINVLDQELFRQATETTIEAFVPSETYKQYKDETQPEIKTTGKIIERLDLDPWPTVKGAYISTDEYIFTNEKELAKYLLFGSLKEQKTYTVRDGDTINQIAFNNELGVEEFLIVNPQFTNPNNLLFPGQQVKVGLIDPIFDVVTEEHSVEDKPKKYKTEIIYDKSMAYGSSKVKQNGVDGLQRITQKLKYVNGGLMDARIVGVEELKSEINEIIVKGTRTSNGGVIVTNDGTWYWPTRMPYIITSSYGWRWGKIHEAIDISGTGYGSPIYAANNGTVVSKGYDAAFKGNFVYIQHADNYYTIYLHLSKIKVKMGSTVTRGQVIGSMGSTGFSTGTHLHFGAYKGLPYGGGKAFNPLNLYR